MNILPKKRWHVRTKDNIARVRRDEAKAAEEEKQKEQRALLAEQEARTSLLRERARARIGTDGGGEEESDKLVGPLPQEQQPPSPTPLPSSSSSVVEHVNLFKDLEDGETTHKANQEHEGEKKKEQEEYEKKIGLLTYLGQDSQELTGERSWWQKLPEKRNQERQEAEEEEKERGKAAVEKTKGKSWQDPLNDIRKYLGCEGVQKYMKASSSSSAQRPMAGKEKEEKSDKKRKRRRSSSSSSDSDGKDKRKRKKKDKRKKKSKKKKHRHQSSEDERETQLARQEKQKKLDKLRQERLTREKAERARTEKLLNPAREEDTKKDKVNEEGDGEDIEVGDGGRGRDSSLRGKRKYNSQFNPEVARQNKLDASKKYWLE